MSVWSTRERPGEAVFARIAGEILVEVERHPATVGNVSDVRRGRQRRRVVDSGAERQARPVGDDDRCRPVGRTGMDLGDELRHGASLIAWTEVAQNEPG